MTSVEFASTVAGAVGGNVAALKLLMQVALGTGFLALRARRELRKIGVEVVQ